MTEAQLRQSAVSVMQGWVGVKEGSAGHKEIVDTYNTYLPHPRGHILTMSDDWCAATASAAGIKAGLTDIIPVECSCTKLIELYKSKGRWVESDSYTPAPGDYIVYDWEDDGKGDCTGQPNHVGMVEKVSGRSITVIEGNKSGKPDSVARRPMTVNGRYIRGYGCPDYASMATPEPVPAPTPTPGGDDDMLTYEQFKAYMTRYEAERAALPESQSWGKQERQWAAETGLIRGGDNGNFCWRAPITREELAVVEYRNAQRTGTA